MSALGHSTFSQSRFTPIQAGGIAASICLCAALVSSVLQGAPGSDSGAARAKAAAAPNALAASGANEWTAPVVSQGPDVSSRSSVFAPAPSLGGSSAGGSLASVVHLPGLARATAATAAAAMSTHSSASAPVGTGGLSAVVAPPSLPPALAALTHRSSSPSRVSSAARSLGAIPTDPTWRPSADASVAAGSALPADPSPQATTTTTTTNSGSGSFTTSPLGVTAATFHGLLPASQGGYNVGAQADPTFAQVVLNETNAAIAADLASQSNAFGIGGYVFPAGSPFGAQNPLFTGQSYGPTWYPSSGTPEPPPSQWAIDPITGLPHDPQTGGGVTPSQWASSSWNPQSPSYDPALYTAAGQTPPS